MPHNYAALLAHVPDAIAEMNSAFSSHELIRRLMWRQQGLFVDALEYYKLDQPFRKVHAHLSKALYKFPHLINYVEHRASPNVFGEVQGCAFWRKSTGSVPATPPPSPPAGSLEAEAEED